MSIDGEHQHAEQYRQFRRHAGTLRAGSFRHGRESPRFDRRRDFRPGDARPKTVDPGWPDGLNEAQQQKTRSFPDVINSSRMRSMPDRRMADAVPYPARQMTTDARCADVGSKGKPFPRNASRARGDSARVLAATRPTRTGPAGFPVSSHHRSANTSDARQPNSPVLWPFSAIAVLCRSRSLP